MSAAALVLGGGGSRGAYEIGVWRALRERGEHFDIVTGTSVGAINGAMIAQGDFDLAEKIWSEITTDMVLSMEDVPGDKTPRDRLIRLGIFAREIAVKGGADSEPLRRLLESVLDEDRVRASGTRFGLVTVRLPDFKPCMLLIDEIPQGQLIDYVLASSAFFPAMRKQLIGDTAYIDGGYFDNLPVALAIRAGAERAVVVDVHGAGMPHRAKELGKLELHVISSGWNLGSILLFDAENARRNMTLGYLDAMKSYGVYGGGLYAFEPGEAEKLEGHVGEMYTRLHELLPASLMRPVLRFRMLRALRAQYRGMGVPPQLKKDPRTPDTLPVGLMLAAAENAGRVFNLPPTKVYTAREFEDAVVQACGAVKPVDMTVLESILTEKLSAPQRMERLLEEADRIDRAHVAWYLLRLLDAENTALLSAAVALPGEMLAALYVKGLRT